MSKRVKTTRIIASLFLIFYIGFIMYTTLLCRQPKEYHQYNFHLFWSYQRFYDKTQPQARQIILNILFFVPYGVLFSTVANDGKRGRKKLLLLTVVSACVLSGIVESLQLFLKLGFAEFDDVFNNTLGALLGALSVLILGGRYKKYVR